MLELLATGCAGLFAGAAIYINLVEHPARVECGNALALHEFGPSYRRATRMQASLAVTGSLTALIAWLTGAATSFLVAGLVLGAVVPFTLVVLYPVNARLLDPTLAPTSPEADELLARWASLHAVRSLASAFAFVLELGALTA
ncbi:MAG: DUF1772 domain-containing protein [Candidatus Binatia bacterium]